MKPADEERDALLSDGVVPLRCVLDPAWLARLGAAIEDDLRNPGPHCHGYASAGTGRFHGNLRLWETHAGFRAVCLDSPLPALARRLLGCTRLNLLYDQLFVKEADTPERTRWHNDQPYWPIRGRQVISLWIALDPTDADNGGLEFVRGSHRWDRWFQPEVFGPNAATDGYERHPGFEPMPDIDAARDDYDIVSWALAPGDAYAFHGLTVHGSGGNTTPNRRRRGYTVRYTGDDVTYDNRVGTNAALRVPGLRDGERIDSQQCPRIF